MSTPAPHRRPVTPIPGAPGHEAAHRVLLVDDERDLAQMVDSFLTRAGFAVTQAHTGTEALELARALDPEVVVLDLGLPGLDGIEVCRRLRTFSDCYVLMLTARGSETDRVVGLAVGADDYITKPFSVRELTARIQAVLRRPRTAGATPPGARARTYGGLRVDVDAREVQVDGRPVELTRTEFDVLAALAERPGVALSRRQLVEAVWGPGWFGDEHVVDVHVAHVRRKLGDDPAAPRHVATVRGHGYKLLAGRAP